MALFNEHTNELEACFKEPQSLECVRRVRELAKVLPFLHEGPLQMLSFACISGCLCVEQQSSIQ